MTHLSNEANRGLLISFEGSEGSGKSTQAARIAQRFERAGYEVIITREPGGTEIGEELRHLLKHDSRGDRMFPETELLLFAACRAQLTREVIIPGLEQGKVIICDRFLDSTTVYQGVGRNISLEPVHIINQFAVGNIKPDVTVVIDVPVEVGLERIRDRVNELPDRLEQENVQFYRMVREGYLMLAKAMPDRFLVADGLLDKDALEEKLWHELQQRVI